MLYVFAAALCLIVTPQGLIVFKNKLTRVAVIYVLWNFLSLIWAAHPFTGWVEALQLIAILLLFLIASNIQPFAHRLSLFATAAGGIVSIIGILQYLGLGFDTILSVGLPSSTFIFRNLLAAYLLGAIPLSLFLIFTSSKTMHRAISIIALTTMTLCLFYTRTRGAWVSIVLGCFLCLILFLTIPQLRNQLVQQLQQVWHHSLMRGLVVWCIFFFAIGVLLPAQTSQKIIQQFDEQKSSPTVAMQSVLTPGSDRGRLDMWQHTFEMIIDHPFLGVGLDNWEYQYPPYDQGSKITFNSEPVRPHNDPLWIASELGLIGLGIYFLLLYYAFHIIWQNLRGNDKQRQWLALTALLGITSLFIYSLFSFPKEQPTPALFFWFFLALLNGSENTPTTKPNRLIPILGLVVCLVAFYVNQRHIIFDQHYQLARSHEQQGQWVQAQQAIDNSLDAGSFDHRARFLNAQYLQKMGKLDDAAGAYLHALEMHPNYAHSHHNLGGVYAARGNFQQAIPALQRALEIRPSYEQARLNLGNVYMAIENFGKAIDAYLFILNNNPQSVQAHTNLGAAYLQQQHFDKAIPYFQKALHLDAKNVQAHNNLAYCLEQTGQIQKAIIAYEALLKHWQGDVAYRKTIRDHIQALHQTVGQP
ncbi:MAG: tetratricopeptide repeat protein [Candidatus Latescibacteria bacterium]|nr:tetratricopeptide repeat protein [Candidatus Latescibacterota bacterium]